MKKRILKSLTCLTLSGLFLTNTALPALAQSNVINIQQDINYEQAYELALIINENISFNEEKSKITFDKDTAINQGLDSYVANQLNIHLEALNEDEVKELYEEMQKDSENTSTRVVPAIIITACKLLAKAGFVWLAQKLYDWGAEKFCENYGDYNSVTENVCDFLGY